MTVPHGGRGWALAPSLIAMEAEADRIAPKRRRSSDGSIGDRAHQSRKSDHNPQESGKVDWVDALDLSHDPEGGFDVHAHARNIAKRRDPRIDYIISNGRIWSNARAREGWRPYSGPNPHTLHAHFSVGDSGRHDLSPWFGASIVFPSPSVVHMPEPDPQPAPEPDEEVPDVGTIYHFPRKSPQLGEYVGAVILVNGPFRLHLKSEEEVDLAKMEGHHYVVMSDNAQDVANARRILRRVDAEALPQILFRVAAGQS